MARARFSNRAKADLLEIGAYTLRTWGEVQAAHYLDGLEQCAKMLARHPALGRSCAWIRSNLFRFEKGKHVFFYRKEGSGILVSRILHQSMMPDRQPFEDEAANL